MAYKLYRHVRVQRVYSKEVVRTRRPQEIADPTRSRGNYQVTMAEFSGVPFEATIGDYKNMIGPGSDVSIAIDENNYNVIAVVNHSTGEEGALKYAKNGLGDLWGTLFFLAVPLAVLGGLAYKFRDSVSYPNAKYVCLGLAAVIAIAVFRGVNKQYISSKNALRELKAGG
ncbi:MAG: hypothetical protein JST02_09710 [Bacteroidetes bacterium]|nr:hypothetical protein [Bacteroidota bacterium]